MKIKFLDVGYTYQSIRTEIDQVVHSTLESGNYLLGPRGLEFAEKFSQRTGTRFCQPVGSGLDAIRIALECLGVGKGDEVLVPSHTFFATWLAVVQVGAIPIGVEVNSQTYCIDPEALELAITGTTKAVIPVHLYGHMAEMDKIMKLATKNNLWVVEDTAHAEGSTYLGKKAGSFGQANAFSFYPGKNLGAFGDGGAITTDSPEVFEKARMFSNYGSGKKYYFDYLGQNSRLDEIQSAILAVKLKHIDKWNLHRSHLAEIYFRELAGLPIQLPITSSNCTSTWHLFVIQTDHRDKLKEHLDRLQIQTIVHYPVPPHLQKPFLDRCLSFPATERICKQVLSLPIGPHLTEENVKYVASCVRRYFNG